MLSEGWDAKTVTHIMGLRAFSSQLLCEQVVGRGLRRKSYDKDENGLFTAEYVNIFGIPFRFLPHETNEIEGRRETPSKVQIEPLPDKKDFEISWPNIIRIERNFKPTLSLDIQKVEPLLLEADQTRLRADLAPILEGGHPDITKMTEIDLEKLDKNLRMQRIIFEASVEVYDLMKADWQKNSTKFDLLGQIIKLTELLSRPE